MLITCPSQICANSREKVRRGEDPYLFLSYEYIIYKNVNSSTKDDFLEDKNQVDDKIAWGLCEGFLSLHSSFVCC